MFKVLIYHVYYPKPLFVMFLKAAKGVYLFTDFTKKTYNIIVITCLDISRTLVIIIVIQAEKFLLCSSIQYGI